ncbi:MAG: PEP-CTERM sorting domain-containing protein [Acidobacteriia bacterium]|nr:PEP-CTERM sorting domain-containing protein [Terriglobia bacterium]
MTALDKAQSFLKSSKTRTALKILPFALAAATASAGTVATTNFAMFQSSGGGGTTVPEPASIMLLTAGVAGTAAYKVLKGRNKKK